jgi:hypothetical protein
VHSSKRYPKDVPVTVRGIEAVGLSRLAVTGRWYNCVDLLVVCGGKGERGKGGNGSEKWHVNSRRYLKPPVFACIQAFHAGLGCI